MISSSDEPVERGLDAMLIVYSLLQSHPAATVCEEFIRAQRGWFTTTLTLFEAKAILSKVYQVDKIRASQKVAQFAAGPIIVSTVDQTLALAAINLADTQAIDLTDAVLLHAAQKQGAIFLATDDRKLTQACLQVGITPVTPVTAAIRQEMVAWEAVNLPAKGLPRLLWQIHQWLRQRDAQVALGFWSQTGGGSHLP